MASDAPDVYLRFVDEEGSLEMPLVGECMDERHPGEQGWIQIKSFKFGFGSEAQTSSFQEKTKDEIKRLTAQQKQEYDKAKQAYDKEKNKKPTAWGESKQLRFEVCSFTKGTDRMSADLMQLCHDGEYKIPRAEIEVVRYGGTGVSFKIPFLHLIFTNVRVKSCTLNLTNEDRPSEDIDFEYDVVNIHSLWTDNETGDRKPEEPIRAGWDLKNAKELLLALAITASITSGVYGLQRCLQMFT